MTFQQEKVIMHLFSITFFKIILYDYPFLNFSTAKKGTKSSSGFLRLDDQSNSILFHDKSISQYQHPGADINTNSSDSAISALLVHSTIHGWFSPLFFFSISVIRSFFRTKNLYYQVKTDKI